MPRNNQESPGFSRGEEVKNTAAFTCCLCDGSGLVPYPVSKTWAGGDGGGSE